MGKKLGDSVDPLLVSVRSGAKFSMPGMMDTILNLGLNDKSVEGLAARTEMRASPGIPIAASSRCSATWLWRSRSRGSRSSSRH
jgi:phosphoenolpyruvate synthase/pyruvate phosphate dikinase